MAGANRTDEVRIGINIPTTCLARQEENSTAIHGDCTTLPVDLLRTDGYDRGHTPLVRRRSARPIETVLWLRDVGFAVANRPNSFARVTTWSSAV